MGVGSRVLGEDHGRTRLDMRRVRILDAMVAVASEEGFAAATVTSVSARAGVSRRVFYEAFDGRESCFLGVLDEAYGQASMLIARAFERTDCWREGCCLALAGLLQLFDAEPVLARVWLVESLAAGVWALERRAQHVAALTRQIVERWRPSADAGSHPLAVVGVMESVLGVIQTHMLTAQAEPMISLLGPLMGVIVAPYLEKEAVADEIERATVLAHGMLAVSVCLAGVRRLRRRRLWMIRVQHRARKSLVYLAGNPGASNRNVADATGVRTHAQISVAACTPRARRAVGEACWPARPRKWLDADTARPAECQHIDE